MVTARGGRRLRPPERGLLQPALAGAPAASRALTGRPVRQGRHLPGQPADDEPGGRPHRRPDRAHRPHLPPEREGRPHHLGDRRLGRERAASAAGPGHRRPGARADVLDVASTSIDRAAGAVRRSTRRTRWRRRRRPGGASSSTSCCGSSSPSSLRKQALERDAKGIRHDVVGRRSSAGSTQQLPFALTGDQRRGDRRDRARPGRPAPDAPAAAGRRRRRARPWWRSRALLVAVQGGHQGAFMAPTEVLAEQHHGDVRRPARRADGPRRPRRLFGEPAAAGRAAHQPHDRGRSGATRWPALADGDVDLRHRHARAHPGGRRVRPASAWS